MKTVVKEEINRMKEMMLHEVGVSKEDFTPNKKLLFESIAGSGKGVVDAILSLTRSVKGIPAKNADELIELISKNTKFSQKSINPKKMEELIVDIYFNKNATAVGEELFDDWTNSVKGILEKGIQRNKKYKNKTLSDIDVTYNGVSKSINEHIDEILNTAGGVKDSFIGVTNKIQEILTDPKLITDSNPEDVIKVIEDNYGDILKLIDPDGKIIKQFGDEFYLIQNGYTRAVKALEGVDKQLEDAYKEAQKRILERSRAAKVYSDAILTKFTKSLGKLMKKWPQFAKYVQAFANILGSFKAWLEYFQVMNFSVKDMKLGTIINIAGTKNLDSIPIANIKTIMDFSMLPARVVKYIVELLRTNGKFGDIKSVEQISRLWSRKAFQIGGMYYTGAIYWLMDGIVWAMKRLLNAELLGDYKKVCFLKIIDNQKEFGFKDLPTSGEGDYTVQGQMMDILTGDGDKDGKFKGFKYDDFVKGVEDAGKEQGVEETWFGWDRSGRIENRKKWEDFIYPYKKDEKGNIIEPKVRTKPYGDVPDWAFYVAACDENGFTFANVFNPEKSYTKRKAEAAAQDTYVWGERTMEKIKQEKQKIENQVEDTKGNIKNKVDEKTQKIKAFNEKWKNSEEVRKEITRLGVECTKGNTQACADAAALSKEFKELFKDVDEQTTKTPSANDLFDVK